MSTSNPIRKTWQKIGTSANLYWAQRNQRERRLLATVGALILIASIYLVFLDPVLSGRAHLQKDLPALRQQAAELQVLTTTAISLSGQQAEHLASQLTKEAVETALRNKDLNPQSVVFSNDMIKVQLSAVAFSGLLDWLDDAQKNAHWQVMDANVSAVGGANAQPGIVNATVTLWQKKLE